MTAASTTAPLLRAIGVHKSFKGVEVLNGVDFTVHAGQVSCIIGPSGSGKSTFLRCINHLEKIDRGLVLLDGEPVGYRRHGDVLRELSDRDLARYRSRVGMVFQHFNLFSHLTALQNVTEGPVRVLKERARDAEERAQELLASVGLSGSERKYPDQLSGGQQQRVAIARALVGDRRLVLADEPTGALDSHTGEGVLRVLRERCDAGAAGLLVTHEARHAAWADRVVFLRDGVIVDESGIERPEALLEQTR
jgi:ABC-type polar amino acid transport system ATPase subunit